MKILPTGRVAEEAQEADFAAVIKLAGDTLANQTKDLQLAAWLAEAHIRRDGVAALSESLELFSPCRRHSGIPSTRPSKRVIPNYEPRRRNGFRDAVTTCCAAFRSRLTSWIGSILRIAHCGLRRRRRLQRREKARPAGGRDEGKITAEEFDEALTATPKKFYEIFPRPSMSLRSRWESLIGSAIRNMVRCHRISPSSEEFWKN